MNYMNTTPPYFHKPAVFISRVAGAICFGHTGISFTDASCGSGYWFHPDGMDQAIHVQPNEVWFDEDAYAAGPPNYK